MLADEIDQLQPVLHLELLVDIVDMISDRVLGDEQFFLDFSVAVSFEDETEDFFFTAGHTVFCKDFFQVLLIIGSIDFGFFYGFVDCKEESSGGKQDYDPEPGGLPERIRHLYIDGGSVFVPDSVWI